MEESISFITLVIIYHWTWRNIPEDWRV